MGTKQIIYIELFKISIVVCYIITAFKMLECSIRTAAASRVTLI